VQKAIPVFVGAESVTGIGLGTSVGFCARIGFAWSGALSTDREAAGLAAKYGFSVAISSVANLKGDCVGRPGTIESDSSPDRPERLVVGEGELWNFAIDPHVRDVLE